MASSCILAAFLLTTTVLSAHAQMDTTTTSPPLSQIPPPSGDLQIYAMPVGQGDCTIMQCPNGNIVVLDCGSSGPRGRRLRPIDIQNHFLGVRIGRVVAIIISHPDRDHFNYLYQISWNIASVNAVIIGGRLQDYRDAQIQAWLRVFATNHKLYMVSDGQPCIGNCRVPSGTNFCNNQNIQFNILAANVGRSPNEKSIVMKAVIPSQAFSILLPADIEGTAATQIANTLGAQLQSAVYKIAHHGASRIANLQNWLAPIRPVSAFASSGYNFGNCRHPRCETITRLGNLGTIVPAPPHDLYCGVPLTQRNNFAHSIYETSPNPNVICILIYVSSATQLLPPNCFLPPPPLSDEAVLDDECPEDQERGGTPSMVSSYVDILVLAFLCFIFII